MSKVTACALTTFDNPFDPFDQFEDWDLFDNEHNYCSSSYLARIARISDQMTDNEYDEEVERAIDEIIKFDFENKYKKVKREIDDH